MNKVRIGMIGSGYIGRCHAIAYAQAPTVFALKGEIVREMLAEVNPALAAQQAATFGFIRSTGDWRELVRDPHIDVVDICAPISSTKEMALEAIRHGKHVYSEKPLSLSVADAEEMVQAAEQAGVKPVGFNYMKNPTSQLAREIIARGEIGEVVHFTAPITKIIWHARRRRSTGTASAGRSRRAWRSGGAYRQHGALSGR